MRALIHENLNKLKSYFTTNIFLLGFVLTVGYPLLLWIVPILDKSGWSFISTYGGYVSVFTLLMILLLYIVKRIKTAIYLLTAILVFMLGISSIKGKYGYKEAVKDYLSLVGDLQNHSQLVSVMASDYEPFINATKLQELVNEKSAETRNFAVKAATKHFQQNLKKSSDRKFIQYLSIFKEINSNWIFVEDPEAEEYFASPDETIQLYNVDGKFNGDCDDHAILMASALKFVGAKVRLVRTPAHIYPEIKIPNKEDLERIVQLIRRDLFKNESYARSIFYHTDPEGNIWLNFDYNNRYPGGDFLDDNIVGILEL